MLGNKIRAARKNANMTQEDLAKEIGVQRSVISKYESDIIDPTVAQLQKIADAIGVLLVDLLDDTSSKVYNAGFIDGAVAESLEHQITFNATPDPEWAELEKKLIDNTITPQELDRYKELLTQGMANAHRAISAAKMRLSEYMDILNAKGQQIAVERVEELTKIPDYQRTEDK